jgi:4-hydroxy-3-methylbut-2-enyl diphosphate reductase
MRTHVLSNERPTESSSSSSSSTASTEGEKKEKFDARAFRRSLNKTGRYVRKPTHDKDSKNLMDDHGVGYSSSGIVARMRDSGDFKYQLGDVTIKLAQSYGFCWGVERAVQMAYEARRAYPGRQLHITNEIIHNPSVNKRLEEMDVKFIEDKGEGVGKDFSAVHEGDVCILPAFGASVHEMKLLHDRGVQIVDTTCPYVSKVWNSVETHTRRKHTSIIHGKWAHEETIATASFAGDYIIVKNMPEAEYLADYILNGGDKQALVEKFKNAISEDFCPDTMLDNVGVANQTTMLKGETMAIGKLFEKTMLSKYGPSELANHFVLMDTICDATQTRQDAMYDLVQHQGTEEGVDMILVVGGYNSSNTCHLQEIAEEYEIPSFWLDTSSRIGPGNETEWMDANLKMNKVAENWLPEGKLTIGVTSGASTPDKVVEDILDMVFTLKMGKEFNGVLP